MSDESKSQTAWADGRLKDPSSPGAESAMSATRRDTHTRPPRYLSLDPQNPDPSLVAAAVQVIRTGQLVILPTDTVYGIGLMCAEGMSPELISRAKQRPQEKSIPLLVAEVEALMHYGKHVPAYATELAHAHWPGALTLIIPASDAVPAPFVAQDGSIALRMPQSTIALALLTKLGAPLACSSANKAQEAPALSIEGLDAEVAAQAALIIDGGSLDQGSFTGSRASTVVSCLEQEPRVLRQGPVFLEEVSDEQGR